MYCEARETDRPASFRSRGICGQYRHLTEDAIYNMAQYGQTKLLHIRREATRTGSHFCGRGGGAAKMALIHWPDSPLARALLPRWAPVRILESPLCGLALCPPSSSPSASLRSGCIPVPMSSVQGVSSMHYRIWAWAPSTAEAAEFGVPSLGRQSFNNMAEARRFSMGIKPHFAAGQHPVSHCAICGVG